VEASGRVKPMLLSSTAASCGADNAQGAGPRHNRPSDAAGDQPSAPTASNAIASIVAVTPSPPLAESAATGRRYKLADQLGSFGSTSKEAQAVGLVSGVGGQVHPRSGGRWRRRPC